jgi:undecaprenyl-diphosphatase
MKLALVTEFIDWIKPFFVTYGYVIVSAGTFLESAALIGLIVPGDIVLALAGVYAGRGDLSIAGVIACGVVFGVCGETVGYLLGRHFGDSLLRRAPIIRRFEHRLEEAKVSIRTNAGKTITIGRFVTGAASFIPFVAGTSGVPPRTFFSFTIPTIAVWATAVTLVGFFVGNNVETIDRILTSAGGVGLVLVLLIVGVWIWRHRGRPGPDDRGPDDRAAGAT